MKSTDRDAAAKGQNPTATPPLPGERCPRCHRRIGTRPDRCALCAPVGATRTLDLTICALHGHRYVEMYKGAGRQCADCGERPCGSGPGSEAPKPSKPTEPAGK